MRVTFLGTGDVYGSGGAAQSCYLVEAGGQTFLLDCGMTVLTQLNAMNIDAGKIDFVAISHLHGDHFAGLPLLLLEFQYNHPRSRPLSVFGPPGTKDRVQEAHRALFKDLADAPCPFSLNVQELSPNHLKVIDQLEIRALQVPHQANHVCLALRINAAGKTLLYSGDTGWTEDLIQYSQGTDLFICECSYYETHVPYHLSYPQILQHREKMGCKRLILSHLGREVLNRAEELTLELARDGMIVEVT